MSVNKSIAFFDFDGTITNKDIFGDFIAYRLKHGLSIWRLVRCIPWLLLYKLKLISNEVAKERIFGILFKDELLDEFNGHIVRYVAEYLPHRLRQDAIERIAWHQEQGHDVYIVSANFDLLLDEFARLNNLKHISTRLQTNGDRLTGKFNGANCYGPEKAARIKAHIPNLAAYATIYAYGDSAGDKELLELSTEKFYQYFKG